ncbi:L,D-transpeptidase family protein [Desulfovibrio inopinatus]|uniref:L,D-transpeptidase family protein n=1 Tax=Desulfovibrio inopinatus TaxID=102109 RepID=UPI00040B1972|nr:L,D-transpeptidase family protein [Desulfovibrio inopinatus]
MKVQCIVFLFLAWLVVGPVVCHAGMNDLKLQDSETAGAMSTSRQCVVVTSSGWKRSRGRLMVFQRDTLTAPWRMVAGPYNVMLGLAGMGWGVGRHGVGRPEGLDGPEKREGDLRSPAGVFDLSFVFGETHRPGLAMPFVATHQDIVCVDDGASRMYNRFARASSADKDWRSSENMMRPDGQYRLGVFVEHNPSPAKPGIGSCIFLHVVSPSGRGTSGCTAMTQAQLEQVVERLDPALHPVLVQLPMAVYTTWQAVWANAPRLQ